MLTFWINIIESDIERFCATLFLPDYMSHLRIAPFRFCDQQQDTDGRQPLVVTYTGEGRLEEFPIYPEKHALDLLRFMLPSLVHEAVLIPEREAIWNWDSCSSNETAMFDEANRETGARRSMRLFFLLRREGRDNQIFSLDAFPPHFSPNEAYVSISRRELHIGLNVVRRFFATKISSFIHRPSTAFAAPEPPVDVMVSPVSGGFELSAPPVGGELLLEEDAVFQEILAFSGLTRSMATLSGQVHLDLNSPEIFADVDGITIPLLIVNPI